MKGMYGSTMAPRKKRHRADSWCQRSQFPGPCCPQEDAKLPMILFEQKISISLKQLPSITVHCALIYQISPKILFFITTNLLSNFEESLGRPATGLLGIPATPPCSEASQWFLSRMLWFESPTLILDPLQQREKKKKAGSLLRPCLRSPLLPPSPQAFLQSSSKPISCWPKDQ